MVKNLWKERELLPSMVILEDFTGFAPPSEIVATANVVNTTSKVVKNLETLAKPI